MPMYFTTLELVYERLTALGLTKSQRHFSTVFLSRSATYMNDYTAKRRHFAMVSAHVVEGLTRRLKVVAGLLPHVLSKTVQGIVELIGAAVRTAALLAR
jgi:hypothetical protein